MKDSSYCWEIYLFNKSSFQQPSWFNSQRLHHLLSMLLWELLLRRNQNVISAAPPPPPLSISSDNISLKVSIKSCFEPMRECREAQPHLIDPTVKSFGNHIWHAVCIYASFFLFLTQWSSPHFHQNRTQATSSFWKISKIALQISKSETHLKIKLKTFMVQKMRQFERWWLLSQNITEPTELNISFRRVGSITAKSF